MTAMWTLLRRGVAARLGRTAITAIAVAAAVAFLAATFILTDTIDAGTTASARQATSSVTAIVTDSGGLGGSLLTGESTLPADLVTRIRRTPGVSAAEGITAGYAMPLNGHGHAVSSSTGIGLSIPADARLRPVTLRSGRWPLQSGEAVIDATTADELHLAPGRTLRVAFTTGTHAFTVTGVVGFGTATTVPGLSIVALTPPDAAAFLSTAGRYSVIEVAGDAHTPARLKSALGSRYTVRTAQEQADHIAASVAGGSSAIGAILATFAGIALIVAALLIANTFAVNIAQRTRELALLRCIGAGRAQTARLVLAEAATIGVVGGVAGLLGGIGLAALLRTGLAALGLPLPDAATVIAPRTVIASLALGVGVTVVAAGAAAVRAARSRPLSALTRDERAEPVRRSGWTRRILAALTLPLGAWQLAAGSGPGPVAMGGLILLVGVGCAAPLLVRPLTVPVRSLLSALAGVPGRLAGRQMLASPHRSAAIAGTLGIAVATVTVVATMAATLTSSSGLDVRRSLHADYVISTAPRTGVDPALVSRIAQLPGVTQVAGEPCGAFHTPIDGENLCGMDPAAFSRLVDVHPTTGDLATALVPGTIAIGAREAARDHFHLGQTITITVPAGSRKVRISALYAYDEVAQPFLVPMSDYLRDFPPAQHADQTILVKTTSPRARSELSALLAAYPQASLDDRAGYAHRVSGGIDLLATIATGFLALSLLIGLISIVTTLALSVLDRTREIGLLRAIGAESRQIRTLVRCEAVTTVTTGAIAGALLGMTIGWPLARAVDARTLGPLGVPVTLLAILLPTAVLVGLLAAALPARRATRLDLLTALQT